ncbi:MAG TPA: hypothetical protein VNJ08_14805 [Bacteriovoracaceae bacterium]|nr:hypothetical protein [Bacteriovoracaceae bacterium]
MKTLSITILVSSLLFLSSCTKNSKSSGGAPLVQETKDPQIETKPEAEVEVEPEFGGQYLAKLKTLNSIVTDRVLGALTISKDGDELVGDVRFSGGPFTASILHVQSIHEGTRCPTAEDDINNDGFIDAIEGQKVYGKILIPLDGDLNSQDLENNIYPAADEFGAYIYSEVASFEKFMADLTELDPNEDDFHLKLDAAVALKLTGKVVIIQGIAPEANLPVSARTNSRFFTNFQTLPIACGVIGRVIAPPGTIRHDEPTAPYTSPAGGDAGIEDGTIIPVPNADGTTTVVVIEEPTTGGTTTTTEEPTTGGTTTTTEEPTTGGTTTTTEEPTTGGGTTTEIGGTTTTEETTNGETTTTTDEETTSAGATTTTTTEENTTTGGTTTTTEETTTGETNTSGGGPANYGDEEEVVETTVTN